MPELNSILKCNLDPIKSTYEILISTLKSQSGSTDKTLPVVCQKNIEIGAAAKAISQ